MTRLALALMFVWLFFAGCDMAGVIVGPAVVPVGYYGGGYYAPDCGPRSYPWNGYPLGGDYSVRSYYRPPVVVIQREPVYSYPAGYYDNQWGPAVVEVAPRDLILNYNGFYYPRGSCYFQAGYYRPYEQYQADYWFQENRQWRHHFHQRDNWRHDRDDDRDYSGRDRERDRHRDRRAEDPLWRDDRQDRPDRNKRQRNSEIEHHPPTQLNSSVAGHGETQINEQSSPPSSSAHRQRKARELSVRGSDQTAVPGHRHHGSDRKR